MRGNGPAWQTHLARSAKFCAAIIFLQSVSQDAAVERGHKQFEQACGFCHGPEATGARGPDLVRSPLVAYDVKGDKLGEIIRLGRPDKGMPACR